MTERQEIALEILIAMLPTPGVAEEKVYASFRYADMILDRADKEETDAINVRRSVGRTRN